MSNTEPKTATASCTFCGKDNTEVEKLIAGPGVYICNECIALCNDIITTEGKSEAGATERKTLLSRPASERLELLPGMARTLQRVEADMATWIRRLIDDGATWDQVAERLDVDEKTARARFQAT
jgi:hypothetical protein